MTLNVFPISFHLLDSRFCVSVQSCLVMISSLGFSNDKCIRRFVMYLFCIGRCQAVCRVCLVFVRAVVGFVWVLVFAIHRRGDGIINPFRLVDSKLS